MPRDGSGIYTKPFPDVVEGTTIESTVHNGTVADVETDLNAPRPIVAGGTGATSAKTARDNLDAEVAGAQVTNYDSHVFESGSFWSDLAATGRPADNYFAGVAVLLDNSQNSIIISVRSLNTGVLYHRNKISGAWSTWVSEKGSNDADYVNTTGDTMSGDLTIAKAGPTLIFNKTSASHSQIISQNGGVHRWTVNMGTNTDDSFLIARHNDAGTFVGYSLLLNRTTGAMTFDADINITRPTAPTEANISFGGGARYLYVTSAGFSFNGAPVLANNGLVSQDIISKAVGGQSKFVFHDASAVFKGMAFWNSPDDSVNLYSNTSNTSLSILSNGSTVLGKGFYGRTGALGVIQTETHNLDWMGSGVDLWVDVTNLGKITTASDYRIKKDVADLPGTWDTVKALRPIKYTQAQYTPQIEVKRRLEEATKARADGRENVALEPMFTADDIERWGFIAHELQATLVESAATGVKDDPVYVQSPNPWTVIAALTRALQEAMARIEALEGAGAARGR